MNEVTRPKLDYTQVPNKALRDERLSLKAKGIYTYLYSKPDHWQFAGDRICKETSDKRDAVYAALKELEVAGYLQRFKKPNGRIHYILDQEEINKQQGSIFDIKPVEENPQQATKKPVEEKPKVGKTQSGKIRTISKTDVISNTDIESNTNTAQSAEEKDIGEIIFLFQEVNPSYKQLFNRKPQREAARRLLQQFGMYKMKPMIAYLSTSNADRYAPTITTPIELESKLGLLKAWADKQRSSKGSKGRNIINAVK